jgi:hypothetical protein
MVLLSAQYCYDYERNLLLQALAVQALLQQEG